MAFYSISDIGDRLLSTALQPVPCLEEGYWLGLRPADHPLPRLLDELSPTAMAAFDLACCHCQRWKTSRQLLDTAERRLHGSLEARGETLGAGGGVVVVLLVYFGCLFSRVLPPPGCYERPPFDSSGISHS